MNKDAVTEILDNRYDPYESLKIIELAENIKYLRESVI